MRSTRLRKLARICRSPRLAAALVTHRVAAATEHIPALRLTRPATLIDVGANKGQFSLAYRAVCPTGRIIAFEPLAEEASRFTKLFGGDDGAELRMVALSDESGSASMHLTSRLDSSSLLEPGDAQQAAFGVTETGQRTVSVSTLATELADAELAGPVMLKIDVQGAELKVLEGLGETSAIDFIYLEASFQEFYIGQPLFDEVHDFMRQNGFALNGIFNQTYAKDAMPAQVDCLYARPIEKPY